MASPKQSGLLLQLLALGLMALIGFLQYLLWIDEDGFRQTQALRIGIRAQMDKNAELTERNRALAAEIADLKNGLMAIEERARSDMGMIRSDETLYRLLEKSAPPTAAGSKSAVASGGPKPPQPAPKPTSKPATTNRAAARKPSTNQTQPAPKPATTNRAAARKPPPDRTKPAPRAAANQRRD